MDTDRRENTQEYNLHPCTPIRYPMRDENKDEVSGAGTNRTKHLRSPAWLLKGFWAGAFRLESCPPCG